MQINRLFQIVYILLNKKTVTARELAEIFGVSRRTICRDIDILSLAGIPVYTERGKGGGIRLLPDFIMNKSLLSEQEQNEILSALNALTNIKTDHTKQILDKLSATFNKTTKNWLEVDLVGWSHENDYFNELKQAILDEYLVEFDYYNSNGLKSARRVEPIQVWFKSKAWYLKAFCIDQQELRLFKLPRIKNLLVTNAHFSKRDYPPSSAQDLNSYEAAHLTAIKLRIAPEMAYRVFEDFYESMVEREPNGDFLVTIEWPLNNWLYNFILSFGKHAEVIEPASLRNTIKEHAQRIMEKYL